MFWLSRPPYLRWAAAALVVSASLVMELRPTETVRHPFAITSIGVGDVVEEDEVTWRDVPAGLLVPVSLPTTAARPVLPGEPLLDPGTQPGPAIPGGWWGAQLELPVGARPGMAVRLVTADHTVDGVIVDVSEGQFGERTGLVAVPRESARAVAAGISAAEVVVLIGR